jgi:hypothetical protein
MLLHARIDLEKTNYSLLNENNWAIVTNPNVAQLDEIYKKYCQHKKFPSVMPIFDSEYTDPKNDIVGYYDNSELVAFSIIRKHNNQNIEARQFAWTYHNPALRLGIKSLEHECALYKQLGFKFLYLGQADEYKKQINGFEILGPA